MIYQSNHSSKTNNNKQTKRRNVITELSLWRTLVCELGWWWRQKGHTIRHRRDVSYPCLYGQTDKH